MKIGLKIFHHSDEKAKQAIGVTLGFADQNAGSNIDITAPIDISLIRHAVVMLVEMPAMEHHLCEGEVGF